MTGTISLRGVRAVGRHGVLAHEKATGQPFVVDVDLAVDLRRAAGSDDLAHTVDYGSVATDVVGAVETGSLDLLETLADRIAERVLERHALVEAVTVTVHKPQAPLAVPFTDVAVSCRRSRDVPVVVALGGNVGDVPATLAAAVGRLAASGLAVTAVSPLFRTAAVLEPGADPQPDYLNAVLTARTSLSPWTLVQALLAVEAGLGRTRSGRWQPRTVDLDLIQYGSPGTASEVVSDDPAATVPHPRAAERQFVLLPWAAADPAAVARVGDRLVPVGDLAAAAGAGGIQAGPPWEPVREPVWEPVREPVWEPVGEPAWESAPERAGLPPW